MAMNWIIERDDKGQPIRMWWAGQDNFADEAERICNKTSEDLGECEASQGIDIQSAAINETKGNQ